MSVPRWFCFCGLDGMPDEVCDGNASHLKTPCSRSRYLLQSCQKEKLFYVSFQSASADPQEVFGGVWRHVPKLVSKQCRGGCLWSTLATRIDTSRQTSPVYRQTVWRVSHWRPLATTLDPPRQTPLQPHPRRPTHIPSVTHILMQGTEKRILA